MKAVPSPLKLHDFSILEYKYAFVLPKKKEIVLQELFASYPIDIDFKYAFEKEGDMFKVEVLLKINAGKRPRAGYSITAECGGLFSIGDDTLKEDVAANLRAYSTVNILIGQMRNFIAQQTALAPFGVYLLPPINIIDLYKKKELAAQKQKKQKALSIESTGKNRKGSN